MLKFLFYLIFIVSVALSAAGIILSARLRNRYSPQVFSSLLYFEVFIYAFGFYGIWGQVAIKVLLSSLLAPEILSRLSDTAMLLGLPFLVFAWLMLIRFSGILSGIKGHRWMIFWFLLFNFSILLFIGYELTRQSGFNTTLAIRYYYIIMNLVCFFTASYLIHFRPAGRSLIHEYDRRIVSPFLFIIMIIQSIPLVFYSGQAWLAVIFIFSFFLGNAFMPFYFSYLTMMPSLSREPEKDTKFEDFCKKFEISPRESEVIREICNGLSNKEISDKLFISLQTVKDHTHRIYIKINVRSRVQLINYLKETNM